MLTISKDEFSRWWMIYCGDRYINDKAFKSKVKSVCRDLGAFSVHELTKEKRIPFMRWVERELI